MSYLRATIYSIFGKSPFEDVVKHGEAIYEVVKEAKNVFELFIEGRYEELEEAYKKVHEKEHNADRIKMRVYSELPKNIFLPVARSDIIELVDMQDKVADRAEDVIKLITFTRIESIPEEIFIKMKEMMELSLESVKVLKDAIEEVSILLKSSFGKKEREKMIKITKEVSKKEHIVDLKEYEVKKELYNLQIDPFIKVHLKEIITEIGRISDFAENTADILRLIASE